MRAFTTGHPDWLTVLQLPAYAPDLNPVEGAWSVMKNGLGNLAAGTTDQLAAAMRHQLDRIQRRIALIAGFLGRTGLAWKQNRPDTQTPAFHAQYRRHPDASHEPSNGRGRAAPLFRSPRPFED